MVHLIEQSVIDNRIAGQSTPICCSLLSITSHVRIQKYSIQVDRNTTTTSYLIHQLTMEPLPTVVKAIDEKALPDVHPALHPTVSSGSYDNDADSERETFEPAQQTHTSESERSSGTDIHHRNAFEEIPVFPVIPPTPSSPTSSSRQSIIDKASTTGVKPRLSQDGVPFEPKKKESVFARFLKLVKGER